jgi:glucosamine kinase
VVFYWYHIKRRISGVTLVLGIDGGGTSCRAALATADGRVIGRAKAGPSNIMTDLTGSRDNIVEAARIAFADAGRDPALIAETPAVLGLAGTNVGGLGERLKGILPFRESAVESDAAIALEGALGEHDGAIAIVGTGSIFVSRKAGKVATIGGWGFLLGDLGSGARIGRDLLQETLLAHDDIRSGSALADLVLEKFGGDAREIVKFGAAAKPAEFGTFAPLVFGHADKGDAVAGRVLARALGDVEEALDALHLVPGDRLCLLGGLADLVAPRLSSRFQALLQKPLQDALGGAVQMALRLFVHGGERKAVSHG